MGVQDRGGRPRKGRRCGRFGSIGLLEERGERARLRDALAATRELKTAMGTMGFNEQGDLVYPTFMVKIVGGKDTPARKS